MVRGRISTPEQGWNKAGIGLGTMPEQEQGWSRSRNKAGIGLGAELELANACGVCDHCQAGESSKTLSDVAQAELPFSL